MSTIWNQAASGWNRAGLSQHSYREPKPRTLLAPVGERKSPPGTEPPTCRDCRYVVCSCTPKTVYPNFSRSERDYLRDQLITNHQNASLYPSELQRFGEHQALEWMMQGLILNIGNMGPKGAQVRLPGGEAGYSIEVRSGGNPWQRGITVVKWLAETRKYHVTFSKADPDPVKPPAKSFLEQSIEAGLRVHSDQKPLNEAAFFKQLEGQQLKEPSLAQMYSDGSLAKALEAKIQNSYLLKISEDELRMMWAAQEHAEKTQVLANQKRQDQAFLLTNAQPAARERF